MLDVRVIEYLVVLSCKFDLCDEGEVAVEIFGTVSSAT